MCSCVLSLFSIIQMRTELIRIQRHALADTVDSVSGTTANLHSAATDVVTCLTSLNHLRGVMLKELLVTWSNNDILNRPLKPKNGPFLPFFPHGNFLYLMPLPILLHIFLRPRHLTGERFNDCIYIHAVCIDPAQILFSQQILNHPHQH